MFVADAENVGERVGLLAVAEYVPDRVEDLVSAAISPKNEVKNSTQRAKRSVGLRPRATDETLGETTILLPL